MGVNDKIRAYNGVVNVINKYNIGKPKRKTYRAMEEYLNDILHKFAADHGIKGLAKNNSPKYKGTYSPVFSSCYVIQNHWKLFREWLNNNYELNK